MMSKNTEFIMCHAENGAIKIDVRMQNETVWLSREATVAKTATVQAKIVYLENIKQAQKKLKGKTGGDGV